MDRQYRKLTKIINKDLLNLFSNIKIRLLAARLNNPTGFKNATLSIDGHNSKIKDYDPDTKRIKLYSYKLKQPGVRTQFFCDINKMIFLISNSKRYGKSADGTMEQ